MTHLGLTLLIACTAPAQMLRVDVGHADTASSTADVQADFFDLSVANLDDQLMGRASKSLSRSIPSTLGTHDRVTVSLEATHARWPTLAFRDRGNMQNTLGDLAEDFVFNEAMLTLTLGDLKPGLYAMTTWHHDAQYEGGKIDIRVNGALAVGGLSQSTGASRNPASAEFTFASTGVDPVAIQFVSQSQSDAFVAYLNGFSLSPVTRLAAFDIDGPDRAVTQSSGGASGSAFVSYCPTGSAVDDSTSGIGLTVQGLRRDDVVDRGAGGPLSGHASASLLRDFVRIAGAAPQTRLVTIRGLQPATEYLLTWYAYDAAVQTGHPMFVYQDRVAPERLKFTNVSQFLYTKANVLEGPSRPGCAAHTFLSTTDPQGEIHLIAGRGARVGSDDPASGPVDALLNGLTVGSVGGLPEDWLARFRRLPTVIQHSAVNPSGDSLAKDYSEEIELVSPMEPAAAEATFEVEPGFRVELVAAEPLVADPVGLSFDDRGRLFVAEMRGYNQGNLVPSSEARRLAEERPLGRVKLLEDVDGDGHFDKSTIYVDKLVWPNGVFAYNGGVFVAAAPDLLYCKDTNGDGVADTRHVVLTGFGYSNWQHLPNSFRWGLDNRIHGASGSGGGMIRGVEEPDANPVQIRGRDFSFDPRTLRLEPTNTSAQFGLSFDDWGNKFLTSNSDHILLVYFEDRYIVRNPFLVAPRSWRLIAAEGRGADVFRISPPEPHRVVWMRMRASGVIQGIIERGGAPTGYITAASGTTIYRGATWPEAYRGNAFTPECSGNLIHRSLLEPDGVGQIARRATPGGEFLASRDIWFRPVNMLNGPDGNLYIADMYRQVINEGVVLPPTLRKCFDLTEGRERGRIYRVVPQGFQDEPIPDLGRVGTEQLAMLLQHPNAWHRTTAARLLYERQDPRAVEPLNHLAETSTSPLGRMHALYALDGQQALTPDVVLRSLSDKHPRCREHAVRLSESVLDDSTIVRDHLCAMTKDDDVRVRYQLAYTLGAIPDVAATQALATLGCRDAGDSWCRLAILSSTSGRAGDLFAATVASSTRPLADGVQALLLQLAQQAGLRGNADQIQKIDGTLDGLASAGQPFVRSIVKSLVTGLEKSDRQSHARLFSKSDSRIGRIYSDMFDEAMQLAADNRAEPKRRVDAIQFLSLGSYQQVAPALGPLVNSRQPHAVAEAALETLGSFSPPQVVHAAIEAWAGLTPQLRTAASAAIFARQDRLPLLLAAIEDEVIRPSQLDPARIQFLTSHPDVTIRDRARRLLGDQSTSARDEVISSYQDALTINGDVRRGRDAFRRVCAKCHRLEGIGHDLGLPLDAIQDKGKESILRNILDPNQNINPQYVNYMIVTEEGRVITGMIVAETANSITLERGEDERDTVLRNAIDEIVDTGMSVMPEGLEKDLTKQDIADILSYLEAVQ